MLSNYLPEDAASKPPQTVGSHFKGISNQDANTDIEHMPSFEKIQTELNDQGATDFVIELFMSDISNKVFRENINLAVALLEGGKGNVQVL